MSELVRDMDDVWEVEYGTFADRFGAIWMMKQFHDATNPPFPYLPVYAEALFKKYVHDDDKLALILQVNGKVHGILLANMNVLELAPTMKVATERLWWISESARSSGISARAWRSMLQKYQVWAKEKGVEIIQMTSYGESTERNRVDAMYKRLGFLPVETHYMKVLGK